MVGFIKLEMEYEEFEKNIIYILYIFPTKILYGFFTSLWGFGVKEVNTLTDILYGIPFFHISVNSSYKKYQKYFSALHFTMQYIFNFYCVCLDQFSFFYTEYKYLFLIIRWS